jgi:hypothetical protein
MSRRARLKLHSPQLACPTGRRFLLPVPRSRSGGAQAPRAGKFSVSGFANAQFRVWGPSQWWILVQTNPIEKKFEVRSVKCGTKPISGRNAHHSKRRPIAQIEPNLARLRRLGRGLGNAGRGRSAPNKANFARSYGRGKCLAGKELW